MEQKQEPIFKDELSEKWEHFENQFVEIWGTPLEANYSSSSLRLFCVRQKNDPDPLNQGSVVEEVDGSLSPRLLLIRERR